MDEGRARHRWTAFKQSPFLPASVLVLILAAAAGLFAGSYTYAMADPTPHRVPVAVVGVSHQSVRGKAFAAGMEEQLNASLALSFEGSFERARQAVEEQRVFGVIVVHPGNEVTLYVSGASGASVAQLLSEAAPKVAPQVGVRLTVRDMKPLQPGDPRGLALFYITLAAVIIGFIGAVQLSVQADGLSAWERIAFTVAYAVLGALSIVAVVDWGLGALDLPLLESWFILALTMFTSGMVFTMFNTLVRRWAMVPTWGLMVLLGNPSSGGAVSWPLLPSPLGAIGRWLPPGASINAQHTAVYFGGHQRLMPFLVLAAWALVSCTVFLVWRDRHPGPETS
ncbi:ABC transporter permease [Nonomuraea gerenzanensis]|uniref:FIG00761799: membrane protein n=1 Tax=Nonomuraea gerenzanensis TaxID=93944 RepID=A0A1M4EDW9_9ACTN|nr:ABC transporter permease [Nonomuraea gerenzanensis]UBU08817.1 ABC transporter permease [Nonomuraea gerenzanensis]SBO97181.1 FIG00761799: membrane protein [Nonomuraea gerenzanensis]